MSELELTDVETEFFAAGAAFEQGEVDTFADLDEPGEKRSFWQRLFRRDARR